MIPLGRYHTPASQSARCMIPRQVSFFQPKIWKTKIENMLTHWSVAQAGSNNEKSRLKFSLDCPFKPKKPHTLHTSILSTGKYIAKFLEFITMCAVFTIGYPTIRPYQNTFFLSLWRGVWDKNTVTIFHLIIQYTRLSLYFKNKVYKSLKRLVCRLHKVFHYFFNTFRRIIL